MEGYVEKSLSTHYGGYFTTIEARIDKANLNRFVFIIISEPWHNNKFLAKDFGITSSSNINQMIDGMIEEYEARKNMKHKLKLVSEKDRLMEELFEKESKKIIANFNINPNLEKASS